MARHVQIPPGIADGQTVVYDAATDTLVAADFPTGGGVGPKLLIGDSGELLANDTLTDWLYGDGTTADQPITALLISDTGQPIANDAGDDWLYGG
jgi:propanediol dehydratase small subunit